MKHTVPWTCCLAMLAAMWWTADARAADDPAWTGNMARNPCFEEDWVNANGEGHVLSFKGDWYYNQKDLIPDYWELKGDWTWSKTAAHGGQHTLKLAAGATASQTFPRAISQEGGGAWGGSVTPPLPIAKEEEAKFAQPWRVRAWCRGGGSLAITCGKGTVTAMAKGGHDWELVSVELPVAQIGPPSSPAIIVLTGPGEFDDVVIQEKLPPAANLLANPSFEKVDKTGYPIGWSRQKKFRAIGPTYYVWTDWNHYFRENRGGVSLDPLISHSGKQALRFDVFPGDEKLVESDLILLNQEKYHPIEVGAYVRADRINLIDIRCVDQDGEYMPAYRPRQPENSQGGTALFGNGTFEWRYVRKFFGSLGGKPLKGFRVRLCARGMNGHTLDDAGTRSYAMASGTVWWDDLHVCERTTDAAAIRARGVQVPASAKPQSGPLSEPVLDLGQRFYGENALSYSFTNRGDGGKFQLQLTTTVPGDPSSTARSLPVDIPKAQRRMLTIPYRIDRLAGELEKQGTFQVAILRDQKPLAEATYHFNTWPVIVDIDVSRHYNLPNENPVTVSLNLGVADATLARVKTLEVQLVRPSDKRILATQTFADLNKAFADSLAALPKKREQSYEFNLPTPAWWVDRTNLILTKIDLTPLRVWPHHEPTRDTVLLVRGLDAAGAELFRQQSDPFCRMQPPPRQPAIDKVEIRDDGAVLINGQPRFLTGATHQSTRIVHSPPIIAQLGLMGHRLTQDMKNEEVEKMWQTLGLYALQAKPDPSIGGTVPVLGLTDAQKKNLAAWVGRGGMKNVVSMNTGGWEATIDFDDPQQVARHRAANDLVRQLTGRPLAISTSGAFNAWWLHKLTPYDINHAETELWGPMDFNVIYTPYMKRAGKKTAWVYLPQLYDNHPFERYRFETYENIIRGSAGVSMIQGIGDPTFNRGLAGELRYLEQPLYSLEKPPAVVLDPPISHKVTRYKNKTYILATNAGPIQIGDWKWNAEIKRSGKASREGDSMNRMWFRPGGIRIHGFRGLPMPELVRKGDKIVQYVWLDPAETPQWVMVAVRGDGRFAHNGVLGNFNFQTFKEQYGNILMYSELNHSVWHDINYVMDDATYQRAVKVMGKAEADQIRHGALQGRARVDKIAYQPEHFFNLGAKPPAGRWHRIEMDADKIGLVGKLVDGFAYLCKDGRALWDLSALERDGKVARVFCENTVGIDRALLADVKIQVPGLKKGAQVRVLFEDRTITADDGGFRDNFEGVDTYGHEAGGVIGDLFGFVKDPDRELARMIPSGYGYSYGPTAVHIYEIPNE